MQHRDLHVDNLYVDFLVFSQVINLLGYFSNFVIQKRDLNTILIM